MATRKIQALEALAERGATEGERVAARNALEKERAKARQRKPEPSRFDRSRPYTPPTNAWQEFFGRPSPPGPKPSGADRYAAFYAFYGIDPAEARRVKHSTPSWTRPCSGSTPKAEPKVTQLRQATPADFPGASQAEASDSKDKVLVEMPTAAQMWSRFGSTDAGLVVWCDKVWSFRRCCGTKVDRARVRYYVSVDIKDLQPAYV